ncbi:hypothetical protein M1L60_32295 [Actinoplanes sp. TRM 88003]|uniref:Uncharacterized protein n=1 Tax=Paractinoplanes aksuensis TaxID=2939490 RepID=A0ABT1DWS1_9ACTN|nr:hypothetical protein [Actinoplanes aksuensis]MCO8275273.1 hypothetical protein [Actinoplanes aksuensis]
MTTEQPGPSPAPPAPPSAEPLRPSAPSTTSTNDKATTTATSEAPKFVEKAERRRGWLRRRSRAASAVPAQAGPPAQESTAPSDAKASPGAVAGRPKSATPSDQGQMAGTAATQPKTDPTKTDLPKVDPAKGEAAKGEAAKTEPAKGDSLKNDAAKTVDAPQETKKRSEPFPTERPPGTPPDPFRAFAATAERPPGWFRRGTRRFARSLVHEYALVTYIALLMSAALTWPTLRYPMHTLPQDIWDPSRQAWQVAWVGHTLMTNPVQLWQSNIFYPLTDAYAFGSSLLGYAPTGMIGEGPAAAILRYNILFVLAHALLLVGGYALVRQLGAGRTGAAVAAVAFAFAPWRLAQEGHLDIISAGGIPLALAMLARGHGFSLRRGLRPDQRRTGWAAVGWIVASWQVSLGFSLGVPFLYVLGLVVVVFLLAVPIRFLRRPAERAALSRLLVINTAGTLFLASFSGLLAIPYFRVPDTGPAGTEIAFFSPPLRSLLIGPAESRIWGAPHEVPRASLGWPAEMALLPGFVLYALALAGLAFSIWTLRQRLLLLAALAGTIVLTLGTNFYEGRYTYLPLFGHLPGSLGLRIPGRLMLWATLLLAILAAGAVAEFVRRAEHLSEQRIPPWPGPWLRLATFVPLMLVLFEGWNATAHPVAPAQPAAMRTVSGPMLVLPTTALTDHSVVLWSTTRFQPLANGAGGFGAAHQVELRAKVQTFPDAASIEYLRSINVDRVLLIRADAAGTPWERAGDIPVDALGIRREDLDDAVVFHLR